MPLGYALEKINIINSRGIDTHTKQVECDISIDGNARNVPISIGIERS